MRRQRHKIGLSAQTFQLIKMNPSYMDKEVFVQDRMMAPTAIRVVKKKIRNVGQKDKIIYCSRCHSQFADQVDSCYPYYDDFTLCKHCLKQLEGVGPK